MIANIITSRNSRNQIFGVFLVICATLCRVSIAQEHKRYTPADERICSDRLNGPGGVNTFCHKKEWHERCWAEYDAVCTYRTEEERIKACCEMIDVKPECMDMCSFKPDIDFLCSSNCWSDFKKLLACAANGNDNTQCCKKRKILAKKENVHCLEMCAGEAPKLADATNSLPVLLKWQPCFQAFYYVMDCHEESYPSEDNWDLERKWEEEKVDSKMVTFVEKYGKCEEKEKKRKKDAAAARRKEKQQKEREEQEAKEKFEEEKGKPGSDSNKQARLEECCKAQKVKPGCMNLCNFKPSVNLICKTECFDDLKKVTYCAANGEDNTDCCKENSIYSNPDNKNCLQFCQGKTPPLDQMFQSVFTMLAYQPCTSGMNWMLQCHKNAYPDKDAWKERDDWKKETIPKAQESTMKKFGKCKK